MGEAGHKSPHGGGISRPLLMLPLPTQHQVVSSVARSPGTYSRDYTPRPLIVKPAGVPSIRDLSDSIFFGIELLLHARVLYR